jgi:hypothetical protein
MDAPDQAGSLANLVGVHARHATYGLTGLALLFGDGVLLVEAVNDTDEATVAVVHTRKPLDDGDWMPSTDARWMQFVGWDAAYWWRLTNQLGFADGVQVELLDVPSRRSIRLQWLTEAGCLRPSVVQDA